MNVIDVVERLRLFPWAYIDCGFRQGGDAVLKQFQQQYEHYREDKSDTVDKFISTMQNAIADVVKRAAPYDVPEDYITFLEYYGGLEIDGINCNFSIFGVGPMVETWYGYVNTADHVLMESGQLGWLSLGRLVFRTGHKYDYQRVLFYLDLAGIVQKYSVIGVGPWGGAEPQELSILSDIHAYSGMWRKVANSFTEWLEQAAETRGIFVYS